jgi:S-formylglutathione hydrolase FrmB
VEISLQCLNQVRGPQDANFLARELPAYIARGLRVQQPGAGWGIAGYSEGGFCAANLGLQDGRVYSYAGVLSGYFRPFDNQLAKPSRQVNPFGSSNRRMKLANTPLDLLRSLPAERPGPGSVAVGRAAAQGVQGTAGGRCEESKAPQVNGTTAALASGGFAPLQFGLIRLRS